MLLDEEHAWRFQELRTATADKDVFAHVPKAQRHLWEYHDGRTINETLQSFTEIAFDLTVAIKLIGFDKDGCVKPTSAGEIGAVYPEGNTEQHCLTSPLPPRCCGAQASIS